MQSQWFAIHTLSGQELKVRDNIEKRLKPSSSLVTVTNSPDAPKNGLVVTIAPGKEDYSGIEIKPIGEPWDLSAFGDVTLRVTNQIGRAHV